MVSHILISRSKSASVIPWRYTILTLYLTTATTLRTSKLSILSTNITATSCTMFNLRCKKWMKNERKEVIWPTPTLSRDGYLMEFRPEQFSNHIKRVEHDTSLIFCSSSKLRRQHILMHFLLSQKCKFCNWDSYLSFVKLVCYTRKIKPLKKVIIIIVCCSCVITAELKNSGRM